MTPIERAIQEIRGWTWTKIPTQPIELYLKNGEPKQLAQARAVPEPQFWADTLAGALARPDAWTDQDRRVVHILATCDRLPALFQKLDAYLAAEREDEDLLRAVLAEIQMRRPATIARDLVIHVRNLSRDGRPTSAGRYVLAQTDAALKELSVAASNESYHNPLLPFLLSNAPGRTPAIAQHLLDETKVDRIPGICRTLLSVDGPRYHEMVAARFRQIDKPGEKLRVGEALAKLDPAKHRPAVREVARAALQKKGFGDLHNLAAEWLLGTYPDEGIGDVVRALERGGERNSYCLRELVETAASTLKAKAAPILLSILKIKDVETTLVALPHLMDADDPAHRDVIVAELRAGVAAQSAEHVVRFVGLAARWKPDALEAELWELLTHKSRPVRAAAARALGRLGDKAVPRASQLAAERKADTRLAAVTVLATAGTPAALKTLEERLDIEQDDDVRDAVLRGLAAAWEASGRKVTKKDIRERVNRCADKLKEPPARWLKPDKLPALKYADGKKLEPDTVRYLLYRQSRTREIHADLEARPLLDLIDRSSAGDFALEVLKGFLGAGATADDRWALSVAALLGDDRVVPQLAPRIRELADSARGKMAEYAVQALALLGTEQALLAVDAAAIRYRVKYKNIGAAAANAIATAAEAAGLTPDELRDRIVPWLGFQPGAPRIIEAGNRSIRASIGLDFKLAYEDATTRKRVASLPKTAPKEVLQEFKDLAASLREVVKSQLLRLENLMVRQRRWPAPKWREMFLAHPLLVPFAVRLAWAAYPSDGKLRATFRALGDRSLTDADDASFALADDDAVGILHPLEIPEDLRVKWRAHLADNEVEPPFPQLDRPVVLLKPDQRDQRTYADLNGTSINGMTFKGRAERLGWCRGSVVDAGGILTYWKGFPAAGVDVLIGLEGMYIGMDMYTEITLGEVQFVRTGSVQFGSYTYDDPQGAEDPRVVPFGQVPPIVFSEAMGDLRKIAGGKDASAGAE